MVFLNGEIRPLGYNVLNNILKIAARERELGFELHHLVTLFRTFASVPAEFVGYTGANSLYRIYQQIEHAIEESVCTNTDLEEAREDFLAMISAFSKYVNLLNAQNLHVFPWVHGEDYPILLN
jgi:hypothetical protein